MNTLIIRACVLIVLAGAPALAAQPLPAGYDPAAADGSEGPIVHYRTVFIDEPLPHLGARLYDSIDLELQLRNLTRDIRVAEAELAVLRHRFAVYERSFGRTSALFVTRQETWLDIVRTEEQLKLLRQQQLLLLRHRNDLVNYRRQLIGQDAVRVIVLD